MGSWENKSGIYSTSNIDIQQSPRLTLVTAPTLSIVSRAEAKNYLKVGSDATDDTLIDGLVACATGLVERESGGVAICQQTWQQSQKGGCKRIKLLRQPVLGVPTVSYYADNSDTTATNVVYATEFRVVQPDTLLHDSDYFESGRDGDGYVIKYDVGVFTASTYTSSNDSRLFVWKTAILRTLAWLYEQREEHVTSLGEGQWSVSYSGELPMGIKRLIMPCHTGDGIF
jgi:hypothetical protein